MHRAGNEPTRPWRASPNRHRSRRGQFENAFRHPSELQGPFLPGMHGLSVQAINIRHFLDTGMQDLPLLQGGAHAQFAAIPMNLFGEFCAHNKSCCANQCHNELHAHLHRLFLRNKFYLQRLFFIRIVVLCYVQEPVVSVLFVRAFGNFQQHLLCQQKPSRYNDRLGQCILQVQKQKRTMPGKECGT